MRYKLLFSTVFFLGIYIIFPRPVSAVENNTLFTKSSLSITGNKITLKMYVKSDENISGVLIPWSYDKDKLKFVSLSSSNFSATYQDPQGNFTRNIVLDSAKDFHGEIELFQIVFEVTSNFKASDKVLITFNQGQLANYRKSYKMAGASFEVTHSDSNTLDLNYSVIPISNDTKTNSVDSNKMLANNAISSNLEQSKKSSNIGAIDTGYSLPIISVICLLFGFLLLKKGNKSKLMLHKI